MNALSATTISIISAELGIVVSLVVFVILTALLLTFIILLFAWKRFRALFFGAKKKRKPQKPQEQKSDAPVKVKAPTERPARKSANNNYYDDGVPTVPLDFGDFPAPAEQKKGTKHINTTFDKIPTVVIKSPKSNVGANSKPTASKPQAKPAAKSATPAATQKNKAKK